MFTRKFVLQCIDKFKGPRRTIIKHVPVMCDEVTKYLCDDITRNKFIDMTFGYGGHASAILQRKGTVVYALDRDIDCFKTCLEMSSHFPNRLFPLYGKFSELEQLLSSNDLNSFDGALIDCGINSAQLDDPQRGFSFLRDGPLDMRMNPISDKVSASDVVNNMDEIELAKVLWRYGDEQNSKAVAQSICMWRSSHGPIRSTVQLANIVASSFHSIPQRRDKLGRTIHPATKSFMALRTFVNNEFNELWNGLNLCHRYLKPGGLMLVITFNSSEDRIVKRIFQGRKMEFVSDEIYMNDSTSDDLEKLASSRWKILGDKEVDETEANANPRSRSARLRIAEKI